MRLNSSNRVEPTTGELHGFNHLYRSAEAQLFVSVAETDSSRYWPWHCQREAFPSPFKSSDCWRKQPSLEQCSLVWHHCSDACFFFFFFVVPSLILLFPSVITCLSVLSQTRMNELGKKRGGGDSCTADPPYASGGFFLQARSLPPACSLCPLHVHAANVCLGATLEESMPQCGPEFRRARHLVLTIWQDNHCVCELAAGSVATRVQGEGIVSNQERTEARAELEESWYIPYVEQDFFFFRTTSKLRNQNNFKIKNIYAMIWKSIHAL